MSKKYKNDYRRAKLRRELAARGDPCAICGRPIDYSLTTYRDPADGKVKPHPMRFEMDDIVPVSRGGDPLDRANMQPVHRCCNQHKGNRMDAAPRPARTRPRTSRDW